VARQGYWEHGSQQFERYLIDDVEGLRRQMTEVPDAADVMFRLSFSGLLGNGRTDWSIIGEGVEPEREARLASYITVIAGRQMTDRDPFGMMIGAGVAKALKVSPGETASLLVSTPGGATNMLEFEIVGVFQTFSKDYDVRAVRIPLAAAQELLATPGAHVGVLLLKSTDSTKKAADALRQRLAPSGFEIRTWVDLDEFYNQTVTLYQQQFGFLAVIILVMLLLSVSNTVNIGVFERVSEFGTMMAIGSRSTRIFGLIVTESLCLGVVGSLLGAAIGVLLAMGISAIGIPMPPPPNADQGYISKVLVVPHVILLAVATGIVSAFLASLLPARKVSRMHIAESLRHGV
jgi:putative ABC transport system permease protein